MVTLDWFQLANGDVDLPKGYDLSHFIAEDEATLDFDVIAIKPFMNWISIMMFWIIVFQQSQRMTTIVLFCWS